MISFSSNTLGTLIIGKILLSRRQTSVKKMTLQATIKTILTLYENQIKRQFQAEYEKAVQIKTYKKSLQFQQFPRQADQSPAWTSTSFNQNKTNINKHGTCKQNNQWDQSRETVLWRQPEENKTSNNMLSAS